MNYHEIGGQVVRFMNNHLSKIGFRNIKSFSSDSREFFINLKDGRQSSIRYIEPGVAGVYWSVEDFECRAVELEIRAAGENRAIVPKLYDRSKFQEALDRMINNHDANEGINWITIGIYLDEICLKSVNFED